MYGKMKEFLAKELADIKAAGLYKNERIITTPQRADIKVNDGEDVLNFCANNYLGLSDNQRCQRGDGHTWLRYVFRTLYLWNSGFAQTAGSCHF